MTKLNVTETFSEGCRLRPALKPILEAFSPLYAKRQTLAETLADKLDDEEITAIMQSGEYPLLLAASPEHMGKHIRESAIEFLPLLASLEGLNPHIDRMKEFFRAADAENDLDKLGLAYLLDSKEKLEVIAAKYNLEPSALVFASSFIVSAVLRAYAIRLKIDDFPEWRKNMCPVCGNPPIISWLGKRPPISDNEFLASGDGKKRLHCGVCGTDWHFVRGICPACGDQSQEARQILGEEDRRHERIDWCNKCNRYLPLIDLRDRLDEPDMDAMALCLLHLDLVASKKGLLPIKPSFWNME